ncbi:MAG: hypothetical protein H3C57_00770 [Gammaproteobacteria bacterium]|nr:hypothetical protein [Gammaproteobacteria bacterium]
MTDDDVISIDDLLRKLLRKLHWIAGSILLFGGLFYAASLLQPSVYRATAVLIAADGEGRLNNPLMPALGVLSGIAGFAGGGAAPATEEALAVMQSRSFSEKFIHDSNLLPELFSKRWDSEHSRWKDDAGSPPTLAQAYAKFNQKVRKIIPDKKTGLINLTIEWVDPTRAAILANGLVARLNDEMRRRAIADADASISYLEAEIAKTLQVETRANLGRLLESQINRRMLATVTEEFAFRVVDPALPPDIKDVARPKRAYYAVSGGVLGLVMGLWVVLSGRDR